MNLPEWEVTFRRMCAEDAEDRARGEIRDQDAFEINAATAYSMKNLSMRYAGQAWDITKRAYREHDTDAARIEAWVLEMKAWEYALDQQAKNIMRAVLWPLAGFAAVALPWLLFW